MSRGIHNEVEREEQALPKAERSLAHFDRARIEVMIAPIRGNDLRLRDLEGRRAAIENRFSKIRSRVNDEVLEWIDRGVFKDKRERLAAMEALLVTSRSEDKEGAQKTVPPLKLESAPLFGESNRGTAVLMVERATDAAANTLIAQVTARFSHRNLSEKAKRRYEDFLQEVASASSPMERLKIASNFRSELGMS